MNRLLLSLFLILTSFINFSQAEKVGQCIRVSQLIYADKCGSSVYIKEKNEWKSGEAVAWIDLNIKKDFSDSSFFMKVYIYDAENKLLGKMDGATSGNRITNSGWDSLFKTPKEFKKGEAYSVHFRIPNNINHDDIKRVLLVYGAGDNLAWKASPNVDLDVIEFEEKSKFTADSSENSDN